MTKVWLISCLIWCCICYTTADTLNTRSAASATLYKPYLYSTNVVADVSGDWMIAANATLTEGNVFILKRNNVTFNYEVAYIYPFQIVSVTTNGRWFAVSDSVNTTIFQLDENYNMINEQHIPRYGKFINLQLNDVLVLVSDGYIDSYKLNQGQWQPIDSLVTLVASPMRINFLEDKLVVAWIKTVNDQAFTFFQRNDTSWYQIDETILSFLGSTSALAWNGNDTLIAFTQILVKKGDDWEMQSIISGGTNVRNAAFLDKNNFITSEFNQDKPAVIYSRANSSDLWTPGTSVVDNLQRPNVDPFFQFFVTGDRVVLLSLDASTGPVRVFIDEIAERCTLQNTVITCAMQLDTCQDVTIADYFTINRPCALTIDPKPYPIRLQNVSGKITAGSFNFTSSDGFQFSCDAVIQCPSSSSNSPSSNQPNSPSTSPSTSPNGTGVPVTKTPSSSVTSSSARLVQSLATVLLVIALTL